MPDHDVCGTRTLPPQDKDNRGLPEKLDCLISAEFKPNQEVAGEESLQNQRRYDSLYQR